MSVVLRQNENIEVCFLLTVFDLVVFASTVLYNISGHVQILELLNQSQLAYVHTLDKPAGSTTVMQPKKNEDTEVCFLLNVFDLVVFASTVLYNISRHNTVEASTTKCTTQSKQAQPSQKQSIRSTLRYFPFT